MYLLVSSLQFLYTGAQAQQAFDLQAHRGGLGLMTESTLEAFTNALELGVTTLELDIQITEDGVAVVTHDRQIQPQKCRDAQMLVANDPEYPYVGKYIKDLSMAQIHTLNCGYQQLPGYPEQKVIAGASMPMLADVFALLETYPAESVWLNIETKVEAGAPEETAPRASFIRVVLEEIERAGVQDRVTIQSFDWGTLMALGSVAPDIPLVALTNGQSFLACGEPGASPWLGGIDMDDFDCDVVAAAASFGASAISPVHGSPQDGRIGDVDYEPFVTAAMVERAHSAGLRVIPWTVDDRDTMHYLMDLGVDGIITNYPDRLREVMQERGLPLPPGK
jgi:glycerophosphoryl diester phosphodiesterase